MGDGEIRSRRFRSAATSLELDAGRFEESTDQVEPAARDDQFGCAAVAEAIAWVESRMESNKPTASA
jgi:hypothetical protein